MDTTPKKQKDTNNMKLKSATFRLLALSAFAIAAPLAVSAQEACTTYVVKEGDTLGNISQAAYGTYDFQMIFNANRDQLASNINDLPVGMELILPCEDGRLTADSELSGVIAAEEEKQETTRSTSNIYEPPLKFVTGNGWKPFTDESLAGGGILVRLATTALQRGGNDREGSVSWVNDWGSHTEVLLPTGAFDISIAWGMPDCTKIDLLGEDGVKRCTDLDATLPVYEVAETFTTLLDSKYVNVTKFEDLAGAKICKPADWSSFPLEEVGLVEPLVTHVRLATPKDCAEAVLNGEVDVMAIELETATDVFAELGAADKVVTNPSLIHFLTYHFIASKKNPRGRIYIAMLNKGLIEMRESGEWYDVVATGLAEYNNMTQ
ncbi:LysM peptidoglycan-binding domain-containing protein [Neogemmobacter tilapiae]|uniref:LysM peptidoglycan-binding domain-containing protein n=1 Tax=Neogemmobacter tilapiae TaxID=875041 RepID=UPI001E335069|nr:transporter substrate-binding domain-containing protein [Gemmobacter tilapiae]